MNSAISTSWAQRMQQEDRFPRVKAVNWFTSWPNVQFTTCCLACMFVISKTNQEVVKLHSLIISWQKSPTWMFWWLPLTRKKSNWIVITKECVCLRSLCVFWLLPWTGVIKNRLVYIDLLWCDAKIRGFCPTDESVLLYHFTG